MHNGVLTLNANKASRALASLRRADVIGTSVWLFEPRGLVENIGTRIARAAVITMPDQSASVVPVPRRPAGLGFGLLVIALPIALFMGSWLMALGLLVLIIGLYSALYRASAPAVRQKLLDSGVLVARSHQRS